MALFPCPYLRGKVECTDEREWHIGQRHPDLLPTHRDYLITTLADPDLVRRSVRFGDARLFSRWYRDLGKYVVVVVVSEIGGRNWIVTAYIARRLAEGETEWQRS